MKRDQLPRRTGRRPYVPEEAGGSELEDGFEDRYDRWDDDGERPIRRFREVGDRRELFHKRRSRRAKARANSREPRP